MIIEFKQDDLKRVRASARRRGYKSPAIYVRDLVLQAHANPTEPGYVPILRPRRRTSTESG